MNRHLLLRPAVVTVAALVTMVIMARPGVAHATASAPVKTLDDIRIEGEIRLPRVLFITSRDSERPFEFLDYYRADERAPLESDLIPVIGDVPALPDAEADETTDSPQPGDAGDPVRPRLTGPTDAAESTAAHRPEAIDTTEEVDR